MTGDFCTSASASAPPAVRSACLLGARLGFGARSLGSRQLGVELRKLLLVETRRLLATLEDVGFAAEPLDVGLG